MHPSSLSSRMETIVGSVVLIAASTVEVVLWQIIENSLGQKTLAFWLTYCSLFVGVLAVFMMSERLAMNVINRWSKLRRMLLDSNYIEGAWIDTYRDLNGNPIFGLYTIRWDGEELVIT